MNRSFKKATRLFWNGYYNLKKDNLNNVFLLLVLCNVVLMHCICTLLWCKTQSNLDVSNSWGTWKKFKLSEVRDTSGILLNLINSVSQMSSRQQGIRHTLDQHNPVRLYIMQTFTCSSFVNILFASVKPYPTLTSRKLITKANNLFFLNKPSK